jgi:nucleoside-diphosphate-sugar epimerase
MPPLRFAFQPAAEITWAELRYPGSRVTSDVNWNRWSSVHIADVAALYVLAIAKAPAGSFMYVESGEEALGEIVKTIAAWLSFGTAPSLSAEEAIATLVRTWRYFRSAPKAAYAAELRLISVGGPPIAQS